MSPSIIIEISLTVLFLEKRQQPQWESAHRAASACHLGAIAAKLGRAINFDPENEKFVNDREANNLIMREFHGSWKLS